MRRHTLGMTLVLVAACGGEDPLYSDNPYQNYEDDKVTVVGGTEAVPIASGSVDGECLAITSDTCIPVDRSGSKYCSDDEGPVDIVVVDGEVAETVCYSDSSSKGPTMVIDEDQDGNVDIPQNENGAVIVFSDTSSATVQGNVSIDGNNVTIYGAGPDKSVINGNLEIVGNNPRIRGVRVTGNVIFEKNSGAILFSQIDGNLVISSNNVLAAENVVFGNVQISGNNTLLIQNSIGGNLANSGGNTVCDGNVAFTDEDEDGVVAETEVGDPLSCN